MKNKANNSVNTQTGSQEPLNKVGIKINGNKTVYAEIADTPEKQSKGLSERDNLDENEGMLFVFPNNSIPTFWMRGMRFALDFIWIDEGTIVQIDENVPPPADNNLSNLKLLKPNQPIDYVLEVNAGFIQVNNIKVGDVIDLPSIK